MHPPAKTPLYSTVALAGFPAAGLGLAGHWQPALIWLLTAFAISLRFSKRFRGYQFTAWIVAVVVAATLYPEHILHVAGFDMRNRWAMLIAIQLVMFGMGTQMSLRDFAGVVRAPRGVLVGILCHFTVMPMVGLALTKIFRFPPEIAAGVILIGSCSSGLASNVMAYIARSNLALSVTVTAVTTMIAPVMTPFWMKVLAGALVPVSYFNMMVEIVKIVLVPIGAALLHDYLKQASAAGRHIVLAVASLAAAWLLFLLFGGWALLQARLAAGELTAVALGGFLLSAAVIGVSYHFVAQRQPWLDRWMPALAIVGILYVTGMTTAAGRDNLMKIGAWLFVASLLHNGAGYFFGYFLSRASGLDRYSARSIAFEVGLQNGGMASGLANAMGKLGTVGLAPAIFIVWMNISGSMLANYWRKRPVRPDASPTASS